MKKTRHLNAGATAAILFAFLLLLIHSCGQQGDEKKKVVYVNSYHVGHPPSDEVTAGFTGHMPADSFQVYSYFMDSKRNSSIQFIEHRAAELFDTISELKPDLLVVSDDNAVKYLVKPYFIDKELPVVFCGVNWSAEQYGLPSSHITGIIEVLPVADLLNTLRSYYPSMKKMLVLNENTTTSRKTKPILDTLCTRMGFSVTQELVDDFSSWKSIFREANENYDVIYLQTMGGIKNWDHDEALAIIEKYIKIPLVTCEDFMMPYSVFGLTQVSREQGEWSAKTTKEILSGTSPARIPVSRNLLSTVWINKRLAEKINFKPDSVLLSEANVVGFQ